MYTRIQQRNLDRLSKSLNDGLSKLHGTWGHGCPTGMEPLSMEEIVLDDRYTYTPTNQYRHSTEFKGERFTGNIKLFLYDDL